MEMYKVIWKEVQGQLNVSLESVVRKDAYINPKLTTWRWQFKTNFHGIDILFGSCVKAATVLKIANIYKEDGKNQLHVFVKKFKIVEGRGSAKSFLNDFEACPLLEN